ncbi:MAG: BatD family protein [Candidatus Eremiobacterota bacterium]
MYITLLTSVASGVDIAVKVDKQEITAGDVIEYTLTVKSDKSIKPAFPEKGLNVAPFELLDFSKTESEENGMIIRNYIYKISIYETGDFELAPVIFKYVINGKEESKSTEKAIKIKVKSVLPADANDIKPIKAPQEFKTPVPYRFLYTAGLIMLILFLLIVISYFLYRKYVMKKSRKEEALPLLPPEEEAHKSIDELIKLNLLHEGKIKDFYITLSDIVRRYVERRFVIMTFEKTTDEIIHQMRQKDIRYVNNLKVLLSDFDLVKFAKLIPSNAECNGHVLKSRNFIDETTIKKEEVSYSKEDVSDEPVEVKQ